MRLCVVADLHGSLPVIPDCDVLAIAGDIAPDIQFRRSHYDPDIMRMEQMRWLGAEYAEWEHSVPAKHIVAIPGNHDWFQYLPEHCRTTLLIDSGVTIDDIEFWGTPWISPVGSWNYMLPRKDRAERFNDIPFKVDVLLAHSPAAFVLDRVYSGDHAGCPELRAAIYRKKPRFVFFGHIHEGNREGVDAVLGQSSMHHVSVTSKHPPRVFDILPNYEVVE